MKKILLEKARIGAEKPRKIGGNLFAVFLRSRKVLAIYLFDPHVDGETVRFVKAEKPYAVGDLIAYSADGQKSLFERGPVTFRKFGNKRRSYLFGKIFEKLRAITEPDRLVKIEIGAF